MNRPLDRSNEIRDALRHVRRPAEFLLRADQFHHRAEPDPGNGIEGYDFWSYRITADVRMRDDTIEAVWIDVPPEALGVGEALRLLGVQAVLALYGRLMDRVAPDSELAP